MQNFKKAIELDGLPPSLSNEGIPENLKSNYAGVAGDNIVEPVPEFIKAPCEIVLSNKNNSWIVLGRDRSDNKFSGYGGMGDTQCAMIDLVVGRMGSSPKTVDKDGQKVRVNPDFFDDAARIYISQKTDVDDNFALSDGSIGNLKTRSAIAAKADAIRIISRDGGIKLVTGVDEKNSQGSEVKTTVGVDLIANNDDTELQPIVKGENLIQCIMELSKQVNDLNGIVDTLLMAQMTLNAQVTHHFHYSPYYGLPTTTSPTVVSAGTKCMMDHLYATKKSLLANKANLAGFQMNFLDVTGKGYINSRYHNVN